jgi:anthranilate synthase component I
MKQTVCQESFFQNQLSYNTPAILTFASDIGTPVDIFAKLSADVQHAFMFESVEGDGRLARYSFLGYDPVLTVIFKNNSAHIDYRDNKETIKQEIKNPVQLLQQILVQFQEKLTQARANASASEAEAIAEFERNCKDLPFAGGLAGYMGYNACQYFEKIPQQVKDPLGVPQGYYGLYDAAIVFDHQYKRIHILSLRGEEHAKSILAKIVNNNSLKPLRLCHTALDEKSIFENTNTSFKKEEYLNAVSQCKDSIRQGEAFQIVLSQRFSLPCQSPALDVYRMLLATNPSPYAYYLKYPEFVYLGSSPETFLQCRNGQLLLRAIAGTRRRGSNVAEDEALCQELKNDEKEMAEHRMLVDLGRNDLGRISKVGTVKPEELAVINKYTHVMHMSTAIKGKLNSDKTCFDAFQSCFPAGTVSGAPKIRAMQLLSQIEPEQRGVYSGAVGYFDLYGNMDSAIAIRSALVKDNMAHVNAGGGIVYDSEPEAEYQESRNKAKSVLQAIKLAGELPQ